MASRIHQFYAVAFEENFSLRQIAPAFPEARTSPLEMFVPVGSDGGLYFFPFGAIVTHDVPAEQRERIFGRLTQVLPKLTTRIISRRLFGVRGSRIDDRNFRRDAAG